QAAQHRQAHVAMALEIAEDQRNDEHLLVVADVAVVGIPGAQPHVKARVLRNDVLVDRPDLRQLPVRGRQQRAEGRQAQVLFLLRVAWGHGLGCGKDGACKFRKRRLPPWWVTWMICPSPGSRNGHWWQVCMLLRWGKHLDPMNQYPYKSQKRFNK